MINKLERIIEVERQVSEKRNASKIRYQEIQSEFREKSQDDIQKLEDLLMDDRQGLLNEAHEQALHEIYEIDKIKDSEIAGLKTQFELRKEDVRKRIIQEVFNNGNS